MKKVFASIILSILLLTGALTVSADHQIDVASDLEPTVFSTPVEIASDLEPTVFSTPVEIESDLEPTVFWLKNHLIVVMNGHELKCFFTL